MSNGANSQPTATTSSSAARVEPAARIKGQRRLFKPQPMPQRKLKKSAQTSAMALFKDVVGSNPSSSVPVDAAPRSSPLGELEVAGKLKSLMENSSATAEGRFDTFRRDLFPHIRALGPGQLPKHVYFPAIQFLAAMREATRKGEAKLDRMEISRLFASLGKFDLHTRNDLIMDLCQRLVLGEPEPTETEQEDMVNGLVNFWKHVSQLKRLGELDQAPRFVLPTRKEITRDIQQRCEPPSLTGEAGPHQQSKALAALFPQYRPEQVEMIVPALLSSVAVLTNDKYIKAAVESGVGPLLQSVHIALSKYPLNEAYTRHAFQENSKFSGTEPLRNFVQTQLPRITEMLNQVNAPWRTDSTTKSNFHTDTEISGVVNISRFHRQLRIAYRSRNTGAVMAIWEDMIERLETHKELAQQLKRDAQFLDFWVFVWCALRRPQKVQDTIELMKQVGVHPTVKTYTAMMHGWKMCKDASKIEALWAKLTESGTKLDIVIWTERISGLIEAGKLQAGVEALTEMASLWKQAVKENRQQFAVEPSIEIVNAALVGLLRIDAQAANQVLAWASCQGFEPNIRTYNILLRESLRSGSPGDVTDLLHSMKNQGVEPDSATFTIFLEKVLGCMGDAAPAEQVQAVNQVFDDIAAADLRPNLETYGKMLYAVAGLANDSDEAINAVISHMNSNGFSITPHMITILIERALSRSPPDIATVRALLHKHRLSRVVQGDQTLWERVMSAFAIGGETDEAMAIFNDLADAGRPVTSLPCLTDLLKMLLEIKDRDNADRVVSIVLAHKMKSTEGVQDRYWKHHFWYLAKETGLLAGKQLPASLQRA